MTTSKSLHQRRQAGKEASTNSLAEQNLSTKKVKKSSSFRYPFGFQVSLLLHNLISCLLQILYYFEIEIPDINFFLNIKRLTNINNSIGSTSSVEEYVCNSFRLSQVGLIQLEMVLAVTKGLSEFVYGYDSWDMLLHHVVVLTVGYGVLGGFDFLSPGPESFLGELRGRDFAFTLLIGNIIHFPLCIGWIDKVLLSVNNYTPPVDDDDDEVKCGDESDFNDEDRLKVIKQVTTGSLEDSNYSLTFTRFRLFASSLCRELQFWSWPLVSFYRNGVLLSCPFWSKDYDGKPLPLVARCLLLSFGIVFPILDIFFWTNWKRYGSRIQGSYQKLTSKWVVVKTAVERDIHNMDWGELGQSIVTQAVG